MRQIEPIVLLLAALLIFFTLAAFAAEYFFKDDAVFFQAIFGIASGVSGALMMRVKPREAAESTTTTGLSTIQQSGAPPIVKTTVEEKHTSE